MSNVIDLVKIALLIAFNKFFSLSILLADFIILGYFPLENLETYTLSLQWSQIAIVFILVSKEGVNYFLNQNNTLPYLCGYIVYVNMVLIGILLLFNLYNHGNLFITNCILLISLIPLSYTNFNLAILENKKLSGTITIVNCILFLFNLLLDLFLIYCCPHNAVLMVAVSTLLTRLLECWLLYYLTYIKLNLSIKPLLKWRVCVDMWAWTNANLLTSSVFIMSIAVMVYFVKNHFHSQDVAAIGICLNYLNNLSVLVTGLVITLIISFNQISIATIKQFIVYYLFLFVSLSFISSFIFHFLYNPQGLLVYLKKHFLLSQVILLFDLLTNIAVTLLRLNGIKTAPLFKLTFPLIGIPLGIGLAYYLNDLDYILYGFIFGNFLSLFLSSGQYMLLQAKNH